MAVEKPYAWIIGHEPHCGASARVHHKRVSSQWCCSRRVETREEVTVRSTRKDLELMAVKMEWMGAAVVV